MLFKTNSITMVTDLNLIENQINNTDYVTVAAVSTESFNNPNIYDASILIPPVEMLMRWADGDQLVMQNMYPRYLMENKDADDMIVALLAALTKKNVILYIPLEDYNAYGGVLLNHIYYSYGIVMNTPNSVFFFDESKLPLILSKFYMMDLIDPADFLQSYPSNYALLDFTIPKLAVDINPFQGRQATFGEYAAYFNKIVNNNRSEGLIDMAKVVK